MKRISSIALVVGLLVLSGCGKTVVKEVLVTMPPTTEAPAPVEAPSTSGNKYQDYLAEVRNFSGQANSWRDADLIELVDLVCDAFDNGSSMEEVVEIFANNSSGSSDDTLFAGVIIGSVKHICPEYEYLLASLS